MQSKLHKRVNAASAKNSKSYNGVLPGTSEISATVISNAKTRQSRRRRKPPNASQDWLVLLLGFLILLGCSFWTFVKMSNSSKAKHNSYIDPRHVRPLNKLYHLPESHPLVGDRSDVYAKTRIRYDELLPVDAERSMEAIRRIRQQQGSSNYNVFPIVADEAHPTEFTLKAKSNQAISESELQGESNRGELYDVNNCPDNPPPGYPYAWPIMTLLDNWSPHETAIPEFIHQSLCVFNYQTDFDKAMNYRKEEVPFLVDEDPNVARAAERWNYPGYLRDLLQDVPHRTGHRQDNHSMYHLPLGQGKEKDDNARDALQYKPPTDSMRMTFLEWLASANNTRGTSGLEQEHWYFRLVGCGLIGPNGSCDEGSSEFLFDELPFFQPKHSLYVVNSNEQKGIHCQLGMGGIIAEKHFDARRNSIVLLGGSRRYILAHPEQCQNLCLFPEGHPFARYSQVDFVDPDLDSFPQFAQVDANEVILQAGQVL